MRNSWGIMPDRARGGRSTQVQLPKLILFDAQCVTSLWTRTQIHPQHPSIKDPAVHFRPRVADRRPHHVHWKLRLHKRTEICDAPTWRRQMLCRTQP